MVAAVFLRKAQQMGAEPFGMAETAARRFSTLDAWTAYPWIENFSSAKISAEVTLNRTGA